MYLPRGLISHLYQHLKKTYHSTAPPVLLLVSLDPDALCACRILTLLLRRDYIAHNIHPVAGYGDLAEVGTSMVQPMRKQQGGDGGVVICLGVGGLVDLSSVLGLDASEDSEDPSGGVEVWIIDARRPWNLGNVFGGNPTDNIDRLNGDAAQVSLGVEKGRIESNYRPGQGGIIVYDDGDIDEEMLAEREAYCALAQMPEIEDDGESDYSSSEDETTLGNGNRPSKKRKSDEDDDGDSDFDGERPRQRRRSGSDDKFNGDEETLVRDPFSVSPSPSQHSSPPPERPRSGSSSPRRLRRRLLRLRRKHTASLTKYYSLGTSYSEPISSIVYSLAESLGREDNDLLWNAIVGVSSLELYGRGMTGVGISTSHPAGGSAGWAGQRGERIRQVLRDEVRRLNPPDPSDTRSEVSRGEASGVIPTTARSPDDNSIRLSPEPRFLLIRHWSLYDSMLHSPYLASRLHTWSDIGRKRLHKLLAKMGVSLTQCKQSYTHMDMDLKKGLRQRLLTYAPMYGLDGLVPPAASHGQGRQGWGFVRSWGWKACLSATDVGVIVGAILEVGSSPSILGQNGHAPRTYGGVSNDNGEDGLIDEEGKAETAAYVSRFFEAYDALSDPTALKAALPIAQHLHRAILRSGATLLEKKQIRHLRAFRMGVVKDGPDVQLFTHPAALTKLALWVAEAINQKEVEAGKSTPLVLASLNEARGVYVVVGTGGSGGVMDWEKRKKRKEKAEASAKRREEKQAERARRKRERAEILGEDEDDVESEEEEEETEDEDDDDNDNDDSDDDEHNERAAGRNRFGNAFQEVVDETNARVRIDSFEHCVVEVKKDDLSVFLEALSVKAVVG